MSEHAYAIGIDIGGSFIKAGTITETGVIQHQCIVPTKRFDSEGLIQSVQDLVLDIQQKYPIAAIGIASTGIVDSKQGHIIQSTTIKNYDGTNWKSIISHICDLPVYVENDARAATWGEFQFTNLPANSTLSLITIGTGIGCGLIIEGKLWSGSYGASGEIGYMTIQADGPSYNGNVGCLEPYASASGIIAYVRAKIMAGNKSVINTLVRGDVDAITIPLIKQAADAADELATEAFRVAGKMLGVGIVNLVHLLNPDRVILGGGITEASVEYVQAAKNLAMERILFASRVGLEITTAKLGNQAAMIGVGHLALKHGNII